MALFKGRDRYEIMRVYVSSLIKISPGQIKINPPKEILLRKFLKSFS
jgi:hypothetical protein